MIDLDVLQVLITAQGTDDELSDIQIEGLVLLQMFCDYNPELWQDITLPRRIRNQMNEAVQSVEVVWNGKLQRRFFPVPDISEHIAEATRQKLVAEVCIANHFHKVSWTSILCHRLTRRHTHSGGTYEWARCQTAGLSHQNT